MIEQKSISFLNMIFHLIVSLFHISKCVAIYQKIFRRDLKENRQPNAINNAVIMISFWIIKMSPIKLQDVSIDI